MVCSPPGPSSWKPWPSRGLHRARPAEQRLHLPHPSQPTPPHPKNRWLLSSFRVVESGRGRGAERRSGLKARAGVADGLVRGASAIMAAIDLVNLSALLDDAKCFALVRQHRWREGVAVPAAAAMR